MQVLVIEDEQRMAELLRRGLTEEGHHVVVARNGTEGLQIAQTCPFDVIVLDIMLPQMNGLAVARHLRESHNRTPVLMLTARDTATDIVNGLDSGGDDYLIKPFSFEVLLARLRSVSRRGPIERPLCLQIADLKLDPATREVTRNGAAINLTPREYALLELLLRNTGRVVARQSILETVWGFNTEVTENNLETFVRLLRLKIDVQPPKLIHTVRGIGYCVKEN